MPKTVGVAVSNATFHFDKLYTYAVLPEQQDAVRLGSMVLVPFGRGSRARMGVVLACDAEPENAKLKCLFDVAPASACLTPELLALVHFLKERTFCTYYEAVKAVIPYGAQYKPTVAADGVTPVLQKQLVRHTENSYRLTGSLPQKPKPTAKQMAAVTLLSGGERTLTELEERGVSRAVLDNLCAKGVLECRKVNRSLDLYGDIPLQNRPLALTAEQQLAYEALRPSLDDYEPHAALLYGVTGSGKTLVFIQLIQRCRSWGAGLWSWCRRNEPYPSNDPAAEIPLWQPGGGAALCAQPHRTAAAMADDPGWRCRYRGGDPQRSVFSAGRSGPYHYR